MEVSFKHGNKGRLAFYGWTDYLLLNLVSTKESHYPTEPADLFVFNLNRVSTELIDAIKESRVFENVYLIQPMHQSKLIGFANKIKRLFSGNKYYRYYAQQMESFTGSTKYTIFFTGAFWSETLNIARYLFTANPEMEINFVEEGTASYLDTDYLYRCMPRGGAREKIYRYMHYRDSYRRAKRQFKYVYLYEPKLKASSDNVKRILPISELVTAERILRKVSDSVNIYPYSACKFFFFITPSRAGQKDVHEESLTILESIMDSIKRSDVLVMLHPDIVGAEAESCRHRSKEMHVIASTVLVEAVFSQVDMSEKVLVSTNSTALITPKLLFNKEPHIIMTHRLFKIHKIKDWKRNEAYLRQILMLYDGKKRVFAPCTIEELNEIVIRF